MPETPPPAGKSPNPNPTLVAIVAAVAITLASLAGFNFVRGHLRWVNPTPPAPVPTPTPTPTPAPTPAPKPDWFGVAYPKDGSHRKLIASMPRLIKAAPDLVGGPTDGRPILLYKAYLDVFKDYPPYPPQRIGDCVSFGHGHGNDLLQVVEWCLANPGKIPTPADIQETDTEALYGMAREAGNMLGNQDGCYGGAAVKAMTTMGVVSRRQLGADGAYSGGRAKQWGRTGAPQAVKDKAAKFKLGSAANVGSWDELVGALGSGHPVTICTGMGFTQVRDQQGFVRRHGHWGHCMVIAGVRFDRPGALVLQSWGMDTPSGPRALDQPPYSFWIEKSDAEAILSEGDSWALSKAPRFGQASASKGRRKLPAQWRRAA